MVGCFIHLPFHSILGVCALVVVDLDDEVVEVLDDLLDLACARRSGYALRANTASHTVDRLKLRRHVGGHSGCGRLRAK